MTGWAAARTVLVTLLAYCFVVAIPAVVVVVVLAVILVWFGASILTAAALSLMRRGQERGARR